MTLTISKCKLSKQQHTITLNYTLGENEKNSLIFTLMICRNSFAHRNAVCKTRDGLAHLISLLQGQGYAMCTRAQVKSVSMGLTASRQTAKNLTVNRKKGEILPSTVNKAVVIARQTVLPLVFLPAP